jgi:hypothetical protein
MTRLNAALRDVIEDLRVRWILAKARARAGSGRGAAYARPAWPAGAISTERSSGQTTSQNRDENLRWAVRKAADVLEQLAGEPVAFVLVLQPTSSGGACQTISNMIKEETVQMLLHAAKGLMVGTAVDVGPPRAN